MKTSRRGIKTYLLTTLAVCNSFLATAAFVVENKGAACILFVNDDIVWARDSLSNRLAFPGGYINAGETPQDTAARETFEETGLAVNVGPQVGSQNESAQFLCKSKTAIPLIQAQGFDKKQLINTLSAPDFSIEIWQAYLMPAVAVEKKELRFPNQISLLSSLRKYPQWQSSTVLLPVSTANINPIHRLELDGIRKLQHALAPDFDSVFKLFNLAGEYVLFFMLVPIVWAYLGWQCGIRLLLLLSLSAEATNILKVVFALPRPYDFMPDLQRMSGHGFGMPSGHVLVATVFWGYCWYLLKPKLSIGKQRLSFALLIVLLIGCAAARVYWGVHFISDVIGGGVLGVLLLSGFIHFDKTGLWQRILFTTLTPWLSTITLTTIAIFYTPGLLSCQISGLLTGLLCGLRMKKTEGLHNKISDNNSGKIITAMLGICGIFLFDKGGKMLINHQDSSILIMLIAFAAYTIIGLWLTIGMYLFSLAKTQRIASI